MKKYFPIWKKSGCDKETLWQITTEGNNKVSHIAKNCLYIAKNLGMPIPIISIIPLRLFVREINVLCSFNPDKPRNLSKSAMMK